MIILQRSLSGEPADMLDSLPFIYLSGCISALLPVTVTTTNNETIIYFPR